MKVESSYLMPFDELIKMLIGNGLGARIPQLMRLDSLPAMSRGDYPLLPAYRACWEQFGQTWWEVISARDPLDAIDGEQIHCRYLADSLQDALRLRPRGTIRFWSCSIKEMDSYLDPADDRTDDPELFKEREMERQYI